MSMPYFLAIDAGGTKTDYVLADQAKTLARVRSGTIKRLRADEQTAQENLETGLAEIQQQSGVRLQQIERTCIGTAGESVPMVANWLRQNIGGRVGGKLLLVGDVEVALDAAFQGGPGVLVLAGTGSNIAGRSSIGALCRRGGWGPVLADQGSGYRIGLQALRAVFMAIDEGKPTLLQHSILDEWKLDSISQLVEYANATPAPDFSNLVQAVVRAAQAEDEIALKVLQQQGHELGYQTRLLIREWVKLEAASVAGPAVACAGSIMEQVPIVRAALETDLQTEFPKLRIFPGVVDPIDGALWRVRSEAAFEARLTNKSGS